MMHKTVSCALTIALTSHLLFYGGYGCLEKNGGKKKMISQIEDVLGQLSFERSDSSLVFFSHRFCRVACIVFDIIRFGSGGGVCVKLMMGCRKLIETFYNGIEHSIAFHPKKKI